MKDNERKGIAIVLLFVGMFFAGMPMSIISLILLKNVKEAKTLKTIAGIEIIVILIGLMVKMWSY